MSVSMSNYFFINYNFAVCLIWQGEPLICSSVLEFGYVWTFILSYAVWNTCQVLNKVLEIELAVHCVV